MLNIGPQELLLILVIALVVVGPQRLPELSRQLGRGIREFRKIQDDVKGMVNLDEVKSMVNLDEVKSMVNLDPDDPAAPPASSSARRAAPETTTPVVHRSSRPAAGLTDAGDEGGAARGD